MTKVCLITCYKQPDYVRAKTLRAAFKDIKTVELIVVKNKYIGFSRYFEVLWELIKIRITKKPDLYFITFRGYEILPFVRLLTIGKPLIFDEFINLVEWVVYEHHKLKENSLAAKIMRGFYRFWLKTANLITTDTMSHAEYSSKLMNIPIGKYVPLIVSTDELTFKNVVRSKHNEADLFKVFYYGSMLPLHGVDTVIEAMTLLKDQPIELVLFGGKDQLRYSIEKARTDGAKIDYIKWVPPQEFFRKFPEYVKQADVCLGGPFGGTVQSQFVITGKTYQFLQMGCPVIIGHNQESKIFTDKQDALIIEQANPKALAGVILWAKDHPAKLNQISKAGQELYQNELSNKCLSEQLTVLLTDKHIL
jgi:glycosyltransferase involved in cell wall biosynthesis